jgi:hypothetical protein
MTKPLSIRGSKIKYRIRFVTLAWQNEIHLNYIKILI